MERYKQSLDAHERAALWTPTAAQTLSKAPQRFPFGAFPIFASHGRGANLWDVDGNRFVDWICGLASLTLGYDHPAIMEAIGRQLRKGVNFSLPTLLESEVAERLCGIFSCGHEGSVRFIKTGSEANESAVRIARRATGRDVIVTVGTGYHSWHAMFSAAKPWHPGVPKAYESLIRTFQYNDLESLELVLDTEVALVILEPTCHEPTTPEFLQGVVDRAHQCGALVCFDEVVCAGRWARGGGQEHFGVTPDLATAGKSLANGMPLACVIGPRALMQSADLTSGTFGGDTLSLAAANAVLDVYEKEPIIETMWERGRALQQGFNDRANALDVPAVCDGYPCKPRIRFQKMDQETNTLAMSLFLQVTAEHGALFHPGGFNVSAALTDADMAVTFNAIDNGLTMVHKALTTDNWSALTGALCQPVLTVRG